MGIKLFIPTALQKFTNDTEEVELNAGKMSEVLNELTTKFPELKKHLFDHSIIINSSYPLEKLEEALKSMINYRTLKAKITS